MFYHAFNGYMEHAFPLDELKPLSCEGEDTLGGYALTLIDSLDMLALLGDRERFTESVEWISKNVRFDINKTVSVFETTIRILGGLLSAHLIASDYATGMKIPSYDDELLHLAEDLARRLLPAFDTPTVFEQVTKNAVRGLWARRSKINLVGAHIDVFTGEWTQKDAGIGTSIDSFYEYLLKAHLLFGDEEYLFIFQEAYEAAMRYLYTDPWYVEVNMNSAALVWPLFNSLQAFWPGLQVLAGDIDPAIRTHAAFFSVWTKYGFTPEGFNLATLGVQVKYLWLLFDLAAGPDNLVENGPYNYIFSTEGHLLPLTPQISLVREHCSYLGAYCKSSHMRQKSYTSDISMDSQETNGTRLYKGSVSTSFASDSSSQKFTSASGLIKGVCPGLTHGQKFGISYVASPTHEDGSSDERETTMVQNHPVEVVASPPPQHSQTDVQKDDENAEKPSEGRSESHSPEN
ncbi:glycosyl hydrolase family 47 protein [Actinidia rufa]|uniref:alpha-1,2-Mannosidase n=1 Tax=Actinidia rufa TaxID=165716 RepID=A0A7J0EGH5_9ERIC|nr:glycosyl hydrolase family 47 protein [Actinidia rufa]